MSIAEIDERKLIAKAQAGDSQAFGELVLAYQCFVYNLALRTLNHPEEAQDAAQEAFLRAWLSIGSFRGEARFSTWLYRVVINLCFNRRPRLRRDLSALSIEDEQDLPDDLEGPAYQVEIREARFFIHQQVEKLPETYRLLITMRYQQELSYEEIADILNIPIGTVKAGLYRAKGQLKTTLQTQPRSAPQVRNERPQYHQEVPQWTQ